MKSGYTRQVLPEIQGQENLGFIPIENIGRLGAGCILKGQNIV